MSRPGLGIKFNEFESGQSFYGHEKILLNNSASDPSYLCEAIGGEIFRAAGVPAAKVALVLAGNMNGKVNLGQSLALTVVVADTIVAVIGLALAVQIRRHFGTLDLKALTTLRR